MSIVTKRLDESRYIALVTEVGLNPGGTVLHGDPAPTRKGAQQPQLFGACLSLLCIRGGGFGAVVDCI